MARNLFIPPDANEIHGLLALVKTKSLQRGCDDAIKRIDSEYAEFVERKYSELTPAMAASGLLRAAGQKTPSLGQKAWSLRSALRGTPEEEELLLFHFIQSEKFWQAGPALHFLKSRISNERYDFYAELIKEQAKSNSGGSTTGHAWLVASHGKGWLGGHISEGELKECVNEGFWELMNTYFNPRRLMAVPDMDSYDALMSYSQYLDLRRTEDFRKKFNMAEPLEPREISISSLTQTSSWPDTKYEEAVRGVLGKLDRETEAWLLCPIIKQIISDDDATPFSFSDLGDIKRLDPYRKYLREPPVKAMAEELIAAFDEEFPE
jgi:hypothetical protein